MNEIHREYLAWLTLCQTISIVDQFRLFLTHLGISSLIGSTESILVILIISRCLPATLRQRNVLCCSLFSALSLSHCNSQILPYHSFNIQFHHYKTINDSMPQSRTASVGLTLWVPTDAVPPTTTLGQA